MVEQAKLWLIETVGAELYSGAGWIYWNLVKPVFSEPRLNWPMLASASIIAVIFYYARVARAKEYRGPLSYLAPARIYAHESSLLDFKYFVVLQIVITHLRLGALVAGLFGMLHVADGVTFAMDSMVGAGPLWDSPSGRAIAGFTLAVLLASDFGKFLAHYALHKIPVLWEFHKVHHAAEVLNPVTQFRVHPVELVVDFLCRLLLTAVVAGIYGWFFASGIAEATILGFNAIAVFISLPIATLQHSHVALGYGPTWSRLLVSPLMHQVHHSAETQHWDKNMGFIFPFWDWMAGTLYVPKADEQFRLGLPNGNERLDSVWRLFVQPFATAAQRLVRRATVQARG